MYQVRLLANGTHALVVESDTPGELNVTVTAHNFIPYESVLPVTTNPAPHLVIEEILFNDGPEMGNGTGRGNQNGKNDAGEIIDLMIKVKNTGIFPVQNIYANLMAVSNITTTPFSIISNTVNNINIPAGESRYLSFLYRIDPHTPQLLANDPNSEGMELFFFDADTVRWYKPIRFDIFCTNITPRNKPVLSTSNGDLTITANETVTMDIELQNTGDTPSGWLRAVLKSTAPNSLISSCVADTINYWDIDKYETQKSATPYQFTTGTGYNGDLSALTFNLEVNNFYGKTWSFPFNLIRPAIVSRIDFTSDEHEIDLTWQKAQDASGYNIYRCDVGADDVESGSYVKLNTAPVTFAFYNDTENLQGLTKYYYKVTAISSSGIEGEPNQILAWTSYPQKYLYPRTMDGITGWLSTPIATADINFDGNKEIFAATNKDPDNSRLVAFDYYGDELFNIDNNITTTVGMAIIGKKGSGIPAIADTHRDGKFRIIAPTRSEIQGQTANNNLYSWTFEDKDSNHIPDKEWVTTPQNLALRGAVVANIDNSSDGSMEVVSATETDIMIYNNKGLLLRTLSSGHSYGAIAVADLDGDGDMEIIRGYDTGIYVWHHNGSDFIQGKQPIYSITGSGYRFRSSMIVCDIDGDGHKDILTSAIKDSNISGGWIFAIDRNGNLLNGWGTEDKKISYSHKNWGWQELTVGDLSRNDNGNLEVVAVGLKEIKIWNNIGQLLNTITIPDNKDEIITPLLADVDGNDDIEIIISSKNHIYAYKLNGNSPLGFPLRAPTLSCNGMNIADVDNDGKNEIIAVSSDKIAMWATNGSPSRIEWGSERHDQYNTGEYYHICAPTVVLANTRWSSNQSVCNDLIVKSGTLTIDNNAEITTSSNSSMTIIMSGATLIIDTAHLRHANVKVLNGGSLIVKNSGEITLRNGGEFTIENGALFENQSGVIE